MEGIFGRAKRRFSLGRLLTRRPDTSATSIALIIIVLNLERILRIFCCFIRLVRIRHQTKVHSLLSIVAQGANGLPKVAQACFNYHTKAMGRLVVQ